MVKIYFFNPWEDVKVGSSEIFLTVTYGGRFQIFFCVNLLALKFGTCVFNIKIMLCQNFS